VSRAESRAETALDELCIKYVRLLRREPEGGSEAFFANAPDDPDAFADAVLAAEGIERPLADKKGRRQVHEVICDWLFDGGRGRGTKSGLLRFPSAA
jgi:hypothetical protein